MTEALCPSEALRAVRARYRALTRCIDGVLCEVARDGQILSVEPGIEALLGHLPARLVGEPFADFVWPEDRAELLETFSKNTSHGGTGRVRFRGRHARGHAVCLEASSSVYPGEAKQLRLIAVLREGDRETPETLLQTQKMASIGRLAGGIAHDFNNLLTAITGYCELLVDELDPEHIARSDAQEILQAAERAATLTQQLLAFSRHEVLRPRILDLNALVASLDRMLRRLIGDDVELVTLLEGGLWPVKADPGRIEQVLVNLVVNARDAMTQGGRISLETGNQTGTQKQAPEADPVPLGDWVTLAVRDTGVGMDPETLEHAFEPFFTTKDPERGTGLGLSTVAEIVDQCGGRIRVRSQPNLGCTFTVYLPRVQADPEISERGEPLVHYRGNETVLLVEDSEPVRRLVARYLSRSGYKVLEGRTAVDALRLCRRHPDPIDLLLTDIVLPRMDGRELARRMRVVRPNTRVAYISGFSEERPSSHGILSDGFALLEKPFTARALLKTVRRALDSPASEPGEGAPPTGVPLH